MSAEQCPHGCKCHQRSIPYGQGTCEERERRRERRVGDRERLDQWSSGRPS